MSGAAAQPTFSCQGLQGQLAELGLKSYDTAALQYVWHLRAAGYWNNLSGTKTCLGLPRMLSTSAHELSICADDMALIHVTAYCHDGSN